MQSMPTYMRHYLLLLTCIIINSLTYSFSQNPITFNGSYLTEHYSSEDYNSSAQVWSATSDERGIMYFGTNRHLVVYDGKTWQKFQARNRSIFRSLATDSNNIVYAGSYNEFGRFLPDSAGGFRYESISKLLPDSLQGFRDVWKTLPSSHGVYFLSVEYIFRYFNENLTVIPKGITPLFGSNINDTIWYVDKNFGLGAIIGGKIKVYPNAEILAKRKSGIVNILNGGTNKLRIITQNRGMFIYNIGDKKLIQDSLQYGLEKYLEKNEVYTAVHLGGSRIALGTIRGGIVIINKNGDLVRIINKARGLKAGSIYALHADKFQNLWAMGSNGIDQIFTNYPAHRYTEKHGLIGYPTNVIQHKGKTYIATLKGLCYIDGYQLNTTNDRHPVHHIKTITESCWSFTIINDQLFVTTSKGIYQVTDNSARMILPNRFTFSMVASKKHAKRVYIGLQKGMATANIRFAKNGNASISNFREIPAVNARVLAIVEGKNNRVWLGTHTSGLQLVTFIGDSPSNYKITRFNEKNGLPKILNNTSPFYIRKKLYIGTKKGLYKPVNLSTPTDSLIRFTYDNQYNPVLSRDTVPVSQFASINDTTFLVDADELGYLHMGKKQKNFITAPFKRIRNEVSHYSYNSNHKIMNICTPDAYYVFNREKNIHYDQPFRPLIRRVTFGNDSLVFEGNFTNKQYLDKIYTKQSADFTPIIKYKNNNLTINYAPAFYTENQKIQYQYKIEGFDENYANWTNKTQATYTNLPEGQYVFKLRAKNIYGVTGLAAPYSFTIEPPWYRTVWAYIFYTLIGILVLIAILRLYTYALQKQNRRLDKMVKQRTKELKERNEEIEQQKEEIRVQKDELEIHKNHLEQLVDKRTEELKKAKERAEESDNLKSAFLANMSHEIRTPMNSIVGYADLLVEEEDKNLQQQFATLINDNINNLLNLINNVVELSRFETGNLEAKKQEVDVDEILQDTYRSYLDRFKEKNIALKIEKDTADQAKIISDKERLHQILLHLTDNALKYTTQGEVIIGRKKQDTDIVFYVKDTGVGMSKKGVEMVFERFTKLEEDRKKLYRGAGIGLALSQKIVHLLGGEIWIESEEGKGTTVYFSVPVEQ